ncbi:hypothetical protein ABEY65_23110, partial [Priestia aryabhattai]|uniref:hypothetical protein n=1 Tax=Priestia aryabhattai TaxID=412384 RepID=UPI003D2A4511
FTVADYSHLLWKKHGQLGRVKMCENRRLKNIYKKTLAMSLIRLGHDLHHTMRNRNNPKYQVYTFVETEALIHDLLHLTERERINKEMFK